MRSKGALIYDTSSPTDDYARVVIYREWALVGAAWANACYIDGELVVMISVSSYTTMLVKPGSRLFHFDKNPGDDPLAIAINLEAGKTYYIKHLFYPWDKTPMPESEKMPESAPPQAYYRLVPTDQAIEEIESCHYQHPAIEVFDGKK